MEYNTKDSQTRTAVLSIIVLLLIVACFLFWYFQNFQPKTEVSEEEATELDTPLSKGGSKIVENVAKTEALCNEALKGFGFETDQAMDGWYDFDENGKPQYYAKTKFGNFSISTKDPDSGEYEIYPQERYVIGNINARDVDNLRTDKFLNQSQLNCSLFYVAEEDEKECIYVDVYNNKAYKTTYLVEEHLYSTEQLTGQEAEEYAYR